MKRLLDVQDGKVMTRTALMAILATKEALLNSHFPVKEGYRDSFYQWNDGGRYGKKRTLLFRLFGKR